MRFYMNLAVLALAASTVSPALAAPTRESQMKSHVAVQQRSIFGDLAYNLTKSALLNWLSGYLKPTTDSSEGRAIAELERRTLGNHDPDKRSVGKAIVGSLATLMGLDALVHYATHTRDASSEMLTVLSTQAKRDVTLEDMRAAFHLLDRALGELD